MLRPIYDLMAQKVRDAQVALFANLVHFDNVHLLQLLHERVDYIDRVLIIAGKDFGLDAPRMVLPATHVVDEREEAEEEIPRVDGALHELLVEEYLRLECAYACHGVYPEGAREEVKLAHPSRVHTARLSACGLAFGQTTENN